MRTTLKLDDAVMRQAKRRALEQGTTLTALIETALRAYLGRAARPTKPYRFGPLVHHGRALGGVDFADRNSLYERMEERA